jgi:hypothetical protein
MDDGKFTKVKKFLAFVTGVGVLWASIIFSKNGFNFNTSSDYIWVGWVLAFAATTTQLIMNSSFKKINWTILLLGLGSYIYSIYTNMLGFHSLRATESIWDILNVCGSFFMDVFPEVAISWALDESKVGDLIGNLLKSAQTPEMLTKTQDVEKRVSSGFNNSGQSQNNNRQTTSQDITSRLPKNKENNNGGRNQGERKQREMYLPYTDAELEYMKLRNPNKDDGSERKSEYRA